MDNIWHGKQKRGREREEERKRNQVTTRPRIETNYACGSNLRRRKYASNAFKVNCISLCRARIVYSSPRRVTMHNTRKSAHTRHYKKRRKEREREKKEAVGEREGKRRGSLRAHENCMENKLHGQREHSCERIIALWLWRNMRLSCTRRKHGIHLYVGQIHRVN